MAISGGPRRLAGLQRTRAAYANEAALAISGRAARRGRRLRDPGARPAPPHIAGSALLGARCGPAGRERRGPRRPPGPGHRQQTLAAPARRLSAGAPGSPLYRVSAPPPAPRAAPPPPPPPAAPPGAGGRGQGSGRRLCLAGLLGRRASCAPGAEGRPVASTRPRRLLARRPRSGSGVPSLRTFSPGSCPLRGLPRRPARPGGSRPERSGVRTPGWRDFGKTNFPVRKLRGPSGSSPPLPSSSLPSAPTPVSPPPHPRAP